MLASLAADVVVLLHFAFILFVVAGGLLVLRYPRVAWLHLPAVAWGALIEFSGGICPLTPLEILFRRAAGEAGYAEGFIAHYLLPLIYPAELTREIQFALGFFVLIVNVAVYGIVALRQRRNRRRRRATMPP